MKEQMYKVYIPVQFGAMKKFVYFKHNKQENKVTLTPDWDASCMLTQKQVEILMSMFEPDRLVVKPV